MPLPSTTTLPAEGLLPDDPGPKPGSIRGDTVQAFKVQTREVAV